jgi:hypothetical protein
MRSPGSWPCTRNVLRRTTEASAVLGSPRAPVAHRRSRCACVEVRPEKKTDNNVCFEYVGRQAFSSHDAANELVPLNWDAWLALRRRQAPAGSAPRGGSAFIRLRIKRRRADWLQIFAALAYTVGPDPRRLCSNPETWCGFCSVPQSSGRPNYDRSLSVSIELPTIGQHVDQARAVGTHAAYVKEVFTAADAWYRPCFVERFPGRPFDCIPAVIRLAQCSTVTKSSRSLSTEMWIRRRRKCGSAVDGNVDPPSTEMWIHRCNAQTRGAL